MTGTPAACAISATASFTYSGISRCSNTALAPRTRVARSLLMSFGHATFDPPTMRIELWPSASRKMKAWPEGLSERPQAAMSKPLSSKTVSSVFACASLPNWQTNWAFLPVPLLRRAAATAWLAPLPPGTITPVSGVRVFKVSPRFGKRLISTMISAFKEPTTSTGPPFRPSQRAAVESLLLLFTLTRAAAAAAAAAAAPAVAALDLPAAKVAAGGSAPPENPAEFRQPRAMGFA
mmetsp:Transcript_129342/g.322443  ORF Transcript_129342/g.322443 Transcript_129342/m.322443 type:complete len:235 (+) Transcript_129342:597-1301(+)